MRPIQLHLPSLVAGVAACALALVSLGYAAPQAKNAPPTPPANVVIIRESVPFTVPKGKVFVLTALGTASFTGGPLLCTLKLNGEVELTGGTVQMGVGGTALFSGSTVTAVAPGFKAAADSKLEVEDNIREKFDGRAWGYLVPE